MTDTTRRDFLKTAGSVAASGMAMSATSLAWGSPLGANDRLTAALIGAGRQGTYDMVDHLRSGQVDVAAICDVYEPNLQKALASARANGARAPEAVADFRRILDRKDIDIIIVGTPDHWHAPVMVMACQAGKDVYVEKPICVHVDEGKKMVEAARHYNRVVQVGTQQRSGRSFQRAVELVWSGQIGRVEFVRTWNYGNEYPDGIGNPPDGDPPAGLDWDMWLGPAPKRPFNANRFGVGDRWSTFRYFWDYAGGMMTDWGVHLLDIVNWALRSDGPRVITAGGGKFLLRDNRETPDTLQATFEYALSAPPAEAVREAEPGGGGAVPNQDPPGCVVVYENRTANGNSMYGKGYGIEFHGTAGTLFVDREGFKLYPETQREHGKEVALAAAAEMQEEPNPHLNHVTNFLECVRTRSRPISDIEIGHRSTSVCLLANVAYRSRQRLVWDLEKQQLLEGGRQAQDLLSYSYRAPWTLSV
ncbi:MAG: Gfo/Idh/MocA family protein [Terriglobales bacterium]